MTNGKVLEFKQELKKLKKRVKQMESQRELTRSFDHKAELIEMKKIKLRMKEMLTHEEYEEIEKWLEQDET